MAASPSDIELVDLSAALEEGAASSFDEVVQVNAMAPQIGIKHMDGFDYVIAKGSTTIDDWLRDAESEAGRTVPGFSQLGLLPIGFSQYAVPTYQAVKPLLLGPIACAGHSLGAPEAMHLAAIHYAGRGPILRIAQFAPPRQGTATLANFLFRLSTQCYINSGDPIPNLPITMKPLWPWITVGPVQPLAVPAPMTDKTPWAQHSVLLYQQGVRLAYPQLLAAQAAATAKESFRTSL